MCKLTELEKEDIVNTYGANLLVIDQIEKILTICDLSDEEYLEIIKEIVFEYECNQTKLYEYNSYKTLEDIIKHVLIYKLKEITNNSFYRKELKKLFSIHNILNVN